MKNTVQSVLLLSGIHLKRYWRILGQLGLFRAAFIVALFAAGFYITSDKKFLIVQSMLIGLIIIARHNQRPDKVFLSNLNLYRPVYFLLQNLLFALPFIIFYLVKTAFVPLAVLLPLLLISAFPMPEIRLSPKSFYLSEINFIPSYAWEWKSGLRKNYLIILLLMIVPVLFYNSELVSYASIVLISLVTTNFLMHHENRMMIQAVQMKPSAFLRLKIRIQLTIFILITLPALIILLSIHSSNWIVTVFVFLSSLVTQILAVVFKYMTFEPGANTSYFMGLLAIINISFLFPPLSPLPVIVLFILYRKAINRLKVISNDFD